jgi:D-aminoacyl-tRNA deacylase
MIAIVCSRADSASEHICQHLRDLTDWQPHEDDSRSDAEGGGTVYRTDGFELREFDDLHLHLEDVAEVFGDDVSHDDPGATDPDLLVFASRHSGETGPLLTAHFTGNFGAADHGGNPGELARACPEAHSRVLDALAEYAPDGYEVGMECTHHGPSSVGVPSMFVEVGSAQPQWADPDAARAVARAILDLRGVDPDSPAEGSSDGTTRRHLVGLGGGHYAPRFGRIARETDWALGHVAADWSLEALDDFEGGDEAVLRQLFSESAAEVAVLDGTDSDLADRIESLGYRVVGETFVRATRNVPLPLVDRLEEALCPVDDGLRFGQSARNTTGDSEFVVRTFPDGLVAELEGTDSEAVRAAIETRALAFATTESGNRIGDQGAFLSHGDYRTLLDDLVSLLRAEYDEVEWADDVVIARKRSFDPTKATDLGVPEGPKFGQLASGESVEIDGEIVEPAQVQSDTVRRFQL